MARIDLYDSEPEFSFSRDEESGVVTLRIKTREATVVLNTSRIYDDVTELHESLVTLADSLKRNIIEGWVDTPEQEDGWVTADRDGYYVSLGGKQVGEKPFPNRQIATYELACAMAEQGYFPNAWISGEHGPAYDELNDQVRAYHDEGGDKLLSLPGVEYAEDDNIVVSGWGAYVIKDYGDLGIVYMLNGDDERRFITDRAEITKVSGKS